MPVVQTHSAPSTLAVVLRQVSQVFSLMGIAVPIQVGRQHREKFGAGTGPKVLFVPELKGKLSEPYVMGRAASWSHSCDVYVRGKETGEDLARFDSAIRLADRVIGCLAVACTGRITWGDVSDDSPLKTDGIGAGVGFSFVYRRDVPHDPARWQLPPADPDTGDDWGDPPIGTAAAGAVVDPVTRPK
jgi:hypothetical protein